MMATLFWVRSAWRRSWPSLVGPAMSMAMVTGAVVGLWLRARPADPAAEITPWARHR